MHGPLNVTFTNGLHVSAQKGHHKFLYKNLEEVNLQILHIHILLLSDYLCDIC